MNSVTQRHIFLSNMDLKTQANYLIWCLTELPHPVPEGPLPVWDITESPLPVWGITEGPLPVWGITEGPLPVWGITEGPLPVWGITKVMHLPSVWLLPKEFPRVISTTGKSYLTCFPAFRAQGANDIGFHCHLYPRRDLVKNPHSALVAFSSRLVILLEPDWQIQLILWSC